MNHVLFTTDRLVIRNLIPADLEDFFAYRSDPEISRYQGFDTFTKEESSQFIREYGNRVFGSPGQWVQYGIQTRRNPQLIGDCAIHIHSDDPETAELGITISGSHQRNGYAREAMAGLMHFLFTEKKMRRILETVDTENKASIGLMNSLHFRQDGHFINNIFFKGAWISEYQFVMLSSEWDLLNPFITNSL